MMAQPHPEREAASNLEKSGGSEISKRLHASLRQYQRRRGRQIIEEKRARASAQALKVPGQFDGQQFWDSGQQSAGSQGWQVPAFLGAATSAAAATRTMPKSGIRYRFIMFSPPLGNEFVFIDREDGGERKKTQSFLLRITLITRMEKINHTRGRRIFGGGCSR